MGQTLTKGFPKLLNAVLFVLNSQMENNFAAVVSDVVDRCSVSGLKLFVSHDAEMGHILISFRTIDFL